MAYISTNNTKVPASRIVQYWATAVVLVALFILLKDVEWTGSTQLHTLMEAGATLLSLMVGVIALVRYYSKKDNTILMLGAAFLGTAFLDGYHAVVTSTFFVDLLPSESESLIPWSWIASRLFLAVTLFLSYLVWKMDGASGHKTIISDKLVFTSTAVFTLACFLFFSLAPLPRAYYPELFFPRPEEFVPALFFAFALVGYLHKNNWKSDDVEHWLILSLIVNFIGQAVFMSYSGQVFDVQFDVAHLLKKVSYILVLIGLLFSIYRAYVAENHLTEKLKLDLAVNAQFEKEIKKYMDKLEHSNEDLAQFTYTISHDLREPLRMVSSFLSLLKNRYQGKLDEEADEYIDFAVDGAHRMSAMINGLLACSRIETRGETFESFDTNQAVENAQSNLNLAISELGATIEKHKLPVINADGSQLVQLFQNLIENALKFRAEAAPVISIAVQHDEDESMWIFSVEDNGIGIGADNAEQVFQVFKRLNDETKYPGHGIGLAVCKRIVERHGGTIWIDQSYTAGTCFKFSIPDSLVNET